MPRTYPYLIVFKEKHGNYNYLVKTPLDPSIIYLSVLTRRFKDGWYDWMKSEKGNLRLRYDMIETVVRIQDALKAGTLIRSQADGEYEGFEEDEFTPFI